MTKDGYLAIRESYAKKSQTMPYASIGYQSYSRNVDQLFFSFKTNWNKKHSYQRLRTYKTISPIFLRPSADIEVACEFRPVRIICDRPKKVRKIRVSTGVSLIAKLIETLRDSR